MKESSMKRIIGILALASIMTGALGVAGPAAPAAACAGTPLKGDVFGTFFFHDCPPGAPAGALCLHDDVAGHLTHLGRTTGSFEVVFDVAAFGEDTCGPISKQGSFIAANGDRLDIEATGTFCFSTLVAVYEFQVTGGTGRFGRARGHGSWVVPPPATFDGVSGTGDEFLTGKLFR
jgi:hypothetical protein